jgi:hypothetical protein
LAAFIFLISFDASADALISSIVRVPGPNNVGLILVTVEIDVRVMPDPGYARAEFVSGIATIDWGDGTSDPAPIGAEYFDWARGFQAHYYPDFHFSIHPSYSLTYRDLTSSGESLLVTFDSATGYIYGPPAAVPLSLVGTGLPGLLAALVGFIFRRRSILRSSYSSAP